jgi:hypothetical protein
MTQHPNFGLGQAAIFAFAGASIKIAAMHSRHRQHIHFMLHTVESSAQK